MAGFGVMAMNWYNIILGNPSASLCYCDTLDLVCHLIRLGATPVLRFYYADKKYKIIYTSFV